MSSLENIFSHLAEHYLQSFPMEAARLLEQRSLAQIKPFLKPLDPKTVVPLMEHLNPHLAQECLGSLPLEKMIQVLEELAPETGAAILRLTPKSKRGEILSRLPKKIARSLYALVHFSPGSAGALMDPNIWEVAGDLKVREVKKMLKNFPEKEFYFLYVVDREGAYVGRVFFLDLLKAEVNLSIHGIQKPPHPFLSVEASSQEILTHPGWQEFPEIPVVDQDKKLLGVLHLRTLHALQDQSGEALITPLATMMQLGETAWVGMMAAYQHLWGV
ncbi:MAG: hypothetical protein R3257_07620, partial [bacterium]|nr:hypothetical protein [bacterium]